jgi:hypothetical protein
MVVNHDFIPYLLHRRSDARIDGLRQSDDRQTLLLLAYFTLPSLRQGDGLRRRLPGKAAWISRQDAGTDRMKEIARDIQEGAMAFLSREYRVLAIFVAVVAVLLGDRRAGAGRFVGPRRLLVRGRRLAPGLAGFIGMRVATKANVRTTNAARTGLCRP